MNKKARLFDVDIDVNSSCDREKFGTRGMIYNRTLGRILPHGAAVYLEPVPVDPHTNLCAFDYEYGNDKGFLKVDLLTNKTYDSFRSKADLLRAVEAEPDWSLLEDEEIIIKMPQLSKHTNLVKDLKPKSIDDLADILALIRPGKTHLLESYKKNKKSTRFNLYRKPLTGEAYFKKSHAYSYAVMIVALLNKISARDIIRW